MATKTFSGRVDEGLLAFADALARREYGLSFGQYCGTVLLEEVNQTGKMPSLSGRKASGQKERAAAFIRGFSSRAVDPSVGRLSDREIRDLVASRYG